MFKDKTGMDMTLSERKLITSICSNERYQLLTIDMRIDKYTGPYRLGLDSLFVPHTNPF